MSVPRLASSRAKVHGVALRVFRAMPRWLRLATVHTLAPRYTVGAVCVLERGDGAVLLVRQAYRRHWGLPGGLLARHESPPDAVVREAREEVGVDVVCVGEPAVVVDPDPRRVDVVFRARLARSADAERVRPSSPEILEVKWFPADALPRLQVETTGAFMALARHGHIGFGPGTPPETGPAGRAREQG